MKTFQHNPNCNICRNNQPFEMPSDLISAVADRRVALFAGAGVSTETPLVFPNTFYDDVKTDLKISESLPFPELMDKYESQPNGRAKLLSLIRKRLEYLNDFIDVKVMATRFHEELATIPQIQEIYTTNWDDLFEQQCGAVPFVTSQDFAFWHLPLRKVFKLHGSISNYGSLIITAKDYEKCYRDLREGLIGSQLKLALATKTMLFVGYSLSDYDFQKFYSFVQKEMGSLLPHSYIVTLDGQTDRFASLGLHPILTDASYFMHVLAKDLVEDGEMLPPDYPEYAVITGQKLFSVHESLFENFPISRFPATVYAAAFQDGLDHGLKFVVSRSRSGYASDKRNLLSLISAYNQKKQQALSVGSFWDAAYIEGFISGLEFPMLSINDRRDVAFYFIFGKGRILDPDEFKANIGQAASLHSESFELAKKKIASEGRKVYTVHHTPFLQ